MCSNILAGITVLEMCDVYDRQTGGGRIKIN